MEKTEPVEKLELAEKSDKAMTGFLEAKPSQMAATQPSLGGTLDGKINQEKKDEVANAPVLTAKTSGVVKEGLTPPDQIPVPSETPLGDGVTKSDPGDLAAQPHKNRGETPNNKANEKLLDDHEGGSFLSWLRSNMKYFMRRIRTKDAGLNMSIGARPNVKLVGKADTTRMDRQRGEAGGKLKGKRDQITDKLKNHPGQKNIHRDTPHGRDQA